MPVPCMLRGKGTYVDGSAGEMDPCGWWTREQACIPCGRPSSVPLAVTLEDGAQSLAHAKAVPPSIVTSAAEK